MVMTVGKLAQRTSLSTDTIRYYERVGLLSEPARTASGYRTYDQSAVERLEFIKDGQRLGLHLREISELLEIRDQGQCPCGHTRALLEKRLTEIQAEITALERMEAEVTRMMASEENGRFQWCCPTDEVNEGARAAQRGEDKGVQSSR